MGFRKEYMTTQWLTKRQVLELGDFNMEVLDAMRDSNSTVADLTAALGNCTSILSVVAVSNPATATAAGVAALVFAAISSLSSVDKDAVMSTLLNGESALRDIRKTMEANNYDAAQVTVAWLEFVDEGYRTVQGASALSYYPT